MKKYLISLILILLLITACQSSTPQAEATPEPVSTTLETASEAATLPVQSPVPENTPSIAETQNAQPPEIPTATANASPTADTRLSAYYWRQYPIVPEISANALQVLQTGIAQGNDPHAFSKLGDCQSEPQVFLGIYGTDRYYLGDGYEYLEDAITYYQGSFDRESAAVLDGLSVTSAFSYLWADTNICEGTESPLECEIRLHNPSVMIISLGTNWKPNAELTFEENLIKIVEYCLERNILPVLSTKADNVEGDNSLNEIIARVAYDYDIPLWNYWRAVQYLPHHGLDLEREDSPNYLIPEAWNEKSFTGLQTLYVIYNALQTK